jgi:hypothetical protein
MASAGSALVHAVVITDITRPGSTNLTATWIISARTAFWQFRRPCWAAFACACSAICQQQRAAFGVLVMRKQARWRTGPWSLCCRPGSGAAGPGRLTLNATVAADATEQRGSQCTPPAQPLVMGPSHFLE